MDLGQVVVRAFGTVTFDRDDAPEEASIRIRLREDSGLALQPLPVELHPGWSRTLPVGRWTVEYADASLSPITSRLDVVEGQATPLPLAIGEGVPVRLTFPFDHLDERRASGGALHLTLTAESSGTAIERRLTTTGPGRPFRLVRVLEPGSYELKARTLWGGVCKAKLIVPASEDALERSYRLELE